MRREELIVTIDGPAGSGKSTIARMLAQRLGGRRLDTGAIYRCVALEALRKNLSNEDEITDVARSVDISFDGDRVLLGGEDVTAEIRTLEVGEMASRVAAMAKVRLALLPVQRALAYPGPTVCEGRDMGTVVFPHAPVKFFLTATAEERARRRWRELREKGEEVEFEEVLRAQMERDRRDETRDVAPLRRPEDAVVIDSTGMTPEEVVEAMVRAIRDSGIEL